MKFINGVILSLAIALFALYSATTSNASIIAGDVFTTTLNTHEHLIATSLESGPDGVVLNGNTVTWATDFTTPAGSYDVVINVISPKKYHEQNGKWTGRVKTTTTVTIDVVGTRPMSSDNFLLDAPPGSVILELDGSAPNLPAGITLHGQPFVLGPHNVFVPGFPAEMPDFESAIEMNDFLLGLELLQESNVILTIKNLPTNQFFLITYLPGTKTWRFVENSIITEEFDGTFTLTTYLNHFSLYGVLYDETSTSGSNWIQYMPYVDAMDRITALQEAYEYARAASTETYANYLFNTLNPVGQEDKQLWPRGEASSETSAQALAYEMATSSWITDYFEVSVVNSGYIIADRSLPVPYYQVKMAPLMDDGTPSFLVDRYHGAKIHRVTATYGNDEDSEKHYAVETYDDPDADFFLMENDIQPVCENVLPPEYVGEAGAIFVSNISNEWEFYRHSETVQIMKHIHKTRDEGIAASFGTTTYWGSDLPSGCYLSRAPTREAFETDAGWVYEYHLWWYCPDNSLWEDECPF